MDRLRLLFRVFLEGFQKPIFRLKKAPPSPARHVRVHYREAHGDAMIAARVLPLSLVLTARSLVATA